MSKIDLDKLSCNPPKDADKDKIKEQTLKMKAELDELQNRLYAGREHAVLIVLQGMDASGKDGTVRNVFENINPQGIDVQAFKVPTAEESAHDFLWRVHKYTPERGMIQIFNRSYYEDILVTRVHKTIDDKTAKRHIEDINNFEKLLVHSGTHILKFFLHISKDEQTERLEERTSIQKKMWKFSSNDEKEAQYWDEYQKYYAECIENCDVEPWIIVPANKNWYKEYIVTKALYDLLKSLHLKYPKVDIKQEEEQAKK